MALGVVGRAATAWALPALLVLVVALPAAASTGRALAEDESAVTVSPAPASQVKEDVVRLLTFRESLDNGASVLPDWKGDDPCGWTGITCDASGLVQKMWVGWGSVLRAARGRAGMSAQFGGGASCNL